jgi:Domain of unknown function (DUF222)
MCTSSNAAPPACAADALAMLGSALDYLAICDAPGLGAAGQAEALVALERAEAKHTAARAKILSAFGASRGFEADGHYGPKPWLRAITRVSKGAADGAVGWAKRLQAHPAVADALAVGDISASWAKEICAWTGQLPEDRRGDADVILLAAASGGADLYDLAALAREMAERSRTIPDTGADRDFNDRQVRLDVTFGGAGQLAGDLTPGCAAALSTVLEALSGKAGPEDTRTLPQRRHDALEEACQRLIAARMLPGRHGEPVHVQVHVDLAALRGLPGASDLEAAWAAIRTGTSSGGGVGNGGAAGTSGAMGSGGGTSSGGGAGWSPARAAAVPGSCYLSGADAEAAACDATIVPVVTGQIDWAALDRPSACPTEPGNACHQPTGPDRRNRCLPAQAASSLGVPVHPSGGWFLSGRLAGSQRSGVLAGFSEEFLRHGTRGGSAQ